QRADARLLQRFGCRRADGKAATAACTAWEIEVESLLVDSDQRFRQRALGAKGVAHQAAAERPVLVESLEIERALVAECRIEARPIHAGRRAQIIERCSGISALPECFGHA